MKKLLKKITATAAFALAVCLSAGVWAGLKLSGRTAAADGETVQITVNLNGGETYDGETWDGTNISVAVPKGWKKLTADFIRDTLFSRGAPLKKNGESHAAIPTDAPDQEFVIPLPPAQANRFYEDGALLKGLKTGGAVYERGDYIEFDADKTLTCEYGDNGIYYGADWSGDNRYVSIRKAYKTNAAGESPLRETYTARDLQPFYQDVATVGVDAFRPFWENEQNVLKSVQLPATVRQIHGKAFRDNRALTAVTGLDSVSNIENMETFMNTKVNRLTLGANTDRFEGFANWGLYTTEPLSLIWDVPVSAFGAVYDTVHTVPAAAGTPVKYSKFAANFGMRGNLRFSSATAPWEDQQFWGEGGWSGAGFGGYYAWDGMGAGPKLDWVRERVWMVAPSDTTSVMQQNIVYVPYGQTSADWVLAPTNDMRVLLNSGQPVTMADGEVLYIPVREFYKVAFDLNGGLGEIPAQYQDAGARSVKKGGREINLASVDEEGTALLTVQNRKEQNLARLYLQKPADPAWRDGGRVFAGWADSTGYIWTDADFGGGAAAKRLTGDTVLTAVWTGVATFNTNGGSDTASAAIGADGKIAEPDAPVKAGRTFGGWYSDKALTQKWDFETDAAADPAAGKILYAKWTKTTDVPGETLTGDKKDGVGWGVGAAGVAVGAGLLAFALLKLRKKKGG
ncbi:MAG: InlB B-repeat-containing protein [Clostridiales bacterium]|jgi:uncharacterized repeat protein (TIGR02543 family)|nr:InlB B-repeat-containing protein [Clostridiales bacterium]